jgi:hypothetical protein
MASLDSSEIIHVIQSHIHPFFVETVLVDPHVENRLEDMVDVEKTFKREFGHSLFIQCDMECHLVVYDITSMGLIVSCAFEPK